MNIFENIDFTSLNGIISFLSSIFSTLVEFLILLITLPVKVGEFFPPIFGDIITIFLYFIILITMYKFFINKD